MTVAPIRLGYVGCGFLAQHVHLPNFASLGGCRLIALAESRPQLGQEVAARYGIPSVYRSHLDLAADSAVEAVAVSAGFAEQGEIAADLLRAGKHVFMEKPMAISLVQAERIIAAAREGGARLMVAYMKRYDPGNELARRLVAEWKADGQMGEIVYARNHGFGGDWAAGLDLAQQITTDEPVERGSYAEHLPAWLPDSMGQHYVDYVQQYTHNVNLLRYLLGVTDDACARAAHLGADGTSGVAVLELGGTRATVESGGVTHHFWDEHTQVYFRNGWIHVFSPPLMAKSTPARLEVYRGGAHPSYSHPIPEPSTGWSFREEAAFFLNALRKDLAFRSDGEDTLTDVRLCEEIYRHHVRRLSEETNSGDA